MSLKRRGRSSINNSMTPPRTSKVRPKIHSPSSRPNRPSRRPRASLNRPHSPQLSLPRSLKNLISPVRYAPEPGFLILVRYLLLLPALFLLSCAAFGQQSIIFAHYNLENYLEQDRRE